MRISDWSSDVCSSDLPGLAAELGVDRLDRLAVALRAAVAAALAGRLVDDDPGGAHLLLAALAQPAGLVGALQIGRASCRERVCQSVSISVVAVSLTKK